MQFKKLLVKLLQFIGITMAMALSFILAAGIANPGGSAQSAPQSPEEAAQAGMALLVVGTVNALILAWLVVRSRWHGLKLIGTIGLIFFAVQTGMSQMETIFFGSAFNIPANQMTGIILSGLLTALFFTPLAVLILGKLRKPKVESNAPVVFGLSRQAWAQRLLLLPGVYVVLYFLFGYFIAWQSPDVRLLYSGSTDIAPFFEHLADTFVNSPGLLLFQYVRGLLWIGLALPILHLMKGAAWEKSLAVGLLFGLLLTTQLLFPNPYMSASVRLAHFIETSTSTFLYGWLIGQIFTLPYVAPASKKLLVETVASA